MSDNIHESNDSNKLTSISISKANYLRLKKLGYTGDTFNTVLGNILDEIYSSRRETKEEILKLASEEY